MKEYIFASCTVASTAYLVYGWQVRKRKDKKRRGAKIEEKLLCHHITRFNSQQGVHVFVKNIFLFLFLSISAIEYNEKDSCTVFSPASSSVWMAG